MKTIFEMAFIRIHETIILIHAAKCQHRADIHEYVFNAISIEVDFNSISAIKCQILHCKTMKNTLKNFPKCQMGSKCKLMVDDFYFYRRFYSK